MAETIEEKIKEAEDLFNNLEKQKMQIHNSQQQLLGRIQTYREFLEKEEEPSEEENPSK